MLFLLKQYQEVTLILLEKLFQKKFSFFIGIFYPSGESILMHLLRYRAFAVDNHSCMPYASHIHQPQLVNNPGLSFVPEGIDRIGCGRFDGLVADG